MVAEFTYYFRSLVAMLGERPGWYGVFAARERGAAMAYERGTDIPPWDVVHAVLHDVAVNSGADRADPGQSAYVYALHRAAVDEQDAAPGAAQALRSRLDAARRARELAAVRAREASRARDHAAAGPSPANTERLINILAWCRDDLARATARCEELSARLTAVVGEPEPEPVAPAAPDPAEQPPTMPAKRGSRARPRGARFAGAYEPTAEAAPVPTSAPVPAAPPAATPRGARFAGAPEANESAGAARAPAADTVPVAGPTPRGARFAGAPTVEQPEPRTVDPRWAAEARDGAARLGRLRRAGETGAAYVALCEAAEGPAERIPYLVRELERTGLGADVATLLWEVAVLPPQPLAAAVSALAADGRRDDCRSLLHQAAARPPADVAVVADLLLHGAGRSAEAGELLETVARARPAADAAALVRARPSLAQPLLSAAERISPPRLRDISAALRSL